MACLRMWPGKGANANLASQPAVAEQVGGYLEQLRQRQNSRWKLKSRSSASSHMRTCGPTLILVEGGGLDGV